MPILQKLTAVFILGLLCSQAAYAQAIPDLATMLENLSTTIPNLMRLVTALSYVMGIFFIYRGILAMKQYGESRTMMSTQHELKGPLIILAVGSALLYLPSSVAAGLSTFWDTTTPYVYLPDIEDPWSNLIKDCFMILELIGTIAFIRGLIILSQLAGHGQAGTFGKGLSHIVGGILCINMYGFVQAVLNTLTLGQL